MANTAKVLIVFVLVALVFVGYFVFGYRVKQNESTKPIASWRGWTPNSAR